MEKWNFPSSDNGQIEGFSNPGLEWFKGDPLQALAREICQNSLDACDDDHQPVRVEFVRDMISTMNFPGTSQLLQIMLRCKEYWEPKHIEKVDYFLERAIRILRNDKMYVLRVSDYNTIGLQGAFDTTNITPWVSLVKSTGVSVKMDARSAGGSYGIGKAAAFINSDIQTVFYRTKDIEGNTAAQGVATLMAFLDDTVSGIDPMRRATGYYGNPERNLPMEHIEALDALFRRTETGTDLFIPGFHWVTDGRANWVEIMVGEILENFLMSVYYGKLSVQIANEKIDKHHLSTVIARNQKYAKNAYCFNKVLIANSEDIVEEILDFHGLGTLRLRLLYASDMNKKILVVRKSGMKISDIKSLPKGISYTGILELQGEELNSFFRKMENPQHNSWDPNRHDNPDLARQYKKEVEEWVRETICRKLVEKTGEEAVIDVGDCFNTATHTDEDGKGEAQERLLDTTKSIEISIQPTKRTSIKSSGGGSGAVKTRGTITDEGDLLGHRHRSGEKGRKPTGRKGEQDSEGRDTVFSGMKETSVFARVIKRGNGVYRLVITSKEDLSLAELEIETIGENGKSLPVRVQSIQSGNASVKDGKIEISNVVANQKTAVDFTVFGSKNYAMGVKVYGN